MYLIPMSDVAVRSFAGNASSPASVGDFSYMAFYSFNKADNRGMILQEDFYSLFQQLHNIGELEDFVNDLERYKLTNS